MRELISTKKKEKKEDPAENDSSNLPHNPRIQGKKPPPDLPVIMHACVIILQLVTRSGFSLETLVPPPPPPFR